MNIFIIPSWYPTKDHPHSGIFTKEQALLLAQHFQKSEIGISLWGQKNESHLLWAKDHFRNLKKIISYQKENPSEYQLSSNCTEYYTPALTWTNNIFEGNIKNIIRANEKNLCRFKLRHGKASVIHAHAAFPAGYIAMHLAKKHALPFIITEHMSPFPLPSYFENPLIVSKLKEAILKAQAIISVSPAAAKDIKTKTKIRPLCIPNLANEKIFTPPLNSQNHHPFKFFTLCGMTPQKGIPDLLNAIAILKNNFVVIRIGGEGECKKEYQELATKLKISHRIEWLGELSRTEVVKEFQQCHSFVLPSLHESMGVVYAEAIACGKPIIATRCGGPEFVVNENNGLLTDVHSPKQLAEAMDYMVVNYSRYQTDIIRKDFLERFSSEVITKKIVSVYEAVIAKKSLPAELFPDN